MICGNRSLSCILSYFVVLWHGIPISEDQNLNARKDIDWSNSEPDVKNIFTGFSKDSSVSSDIKDKEEQARVGELEFDLKVPNVLFFYQSKKNNGSKRLYINHFTCNF